MKNFWVFFLFFFTLFFSLKPLYALADDTYQAHLIELALQKKLDEQPLWHILLHYKNNFKGKMESLIDDPAFFNSPTGKTDPRSELIYTLKAFFLPEEKESVHAQCRFVARFHWLSEQLGIDNEFLPKPDCQEFNEFIKTVNPKKAVLVFPIGFFNSPASMFGHTLLRVDSSYKSSLLSYAINYAASTNEQFGFLYAIKGLFGAYKGYYSIQPYYERIKKYNHMEHRDIWEYKLDMNEEEVKKMVMHAWELKDIFSYYYFFDENCSYNLLFLIEAGKPSLRLTDRFHLWVIPIDTVRAVDSEEELTEQIYRPSERTKMDFLSSQMSQENLSLAKEISKEKSPDILSTYPGLSEENKQSILDLSTEYLRYLFSAKKIEKEGYTLKFLEILNARSKLGINVTEVPPPVSPEKGHNSARISYGFGSSDGDTFSSLKIRPDYHDLTDPGIGYISGSSISFFDTELRFDHSKGQIKLEKLSLIDITSISPRNFFFKPLSWKVFTGFVSEKISKEKERFIFTLNTGGGFAFKLLNKANIYTLLEPVVKIGGEVKENYALGIGLGAGFLIEMTPGWKIHTYAKRAFFEAGENHEETQVLIQQGYSITQNNAIKLDLSWKKHSEYSFSEGTLSWNFYF